MSDPLLPGPAAYRRPDPDDMAETELMLRQKLTESQNWNQMAPPPVPVSVAAPVPASVSAPVPPVYDPALIVPVDVPTLLEAAEEEEATAPDVAGAKKTPGKTRTRAGTGTARTTRRRKTSSTPIKDESDNPSSEEFTMEGIKTKSGRKVHRPAHFNPAQKQPSRRRGPYRRIHDSRICKICQRGHSPQSNMIVFCDGCNTPFHQLCHDPPIDDLVIAVAEAEWFCSSCAKKREEKPLATGLSGQGLTEDEKRTYLASLPLSSLVELVFFAERAHPDLPLYDPQTRHIVEGIKKASVAAVTKEDGVAEVGAGAADLATLEITDVGGVPNWEDMIVRAIIAIGDEKGSQAKAIFEWLGSNYPAIEGRDIRSEAQGSLQSALRKNRLLREGHSYKVNPAFVSGKPTHALLDSIPVIAPGSGIKLPPETEDMLVDDDLVAFSHKWRVGVAPEDQDAEGELDAEGEQDAEGVEDVVL